MKATLRARDVHEAARRTYNAIILKRQEMAREWVDIDRHNYEHGFLWRRFFPRDEEFWQARYEKYLNHPRVLSLHDAQKQSALVILALAEGALMLADDARMEVDEGTMSSIEFGFSQLRNEKQKVQPDVPAGEGGTGPVGVTPLPPVTGLLHQGKPLLKG